MHKMEISLGQRYYQFVCVCLRGPLTTRHSEVLHYPCEAGRAVTYSALLRLCLDLRQKKMDSQMKRRLLLIFQLVSPQWEMLAATPGGRYRINLSGFEPVRGSQNWNGNALYSFFFLSLSTAYSACAEVITGLILRVFKKNSNNCLIMGAIV